MPGLPRPLPKETPGFQVRRPVLAPLFLAMAFLLVALLASNRWLSERFQSELLDRDVREIGANLHDLLDRESRNLHHHLLVLSRVEAFQNAFRNADREGLQKASQPLLAAYQEQQITHWYFHRTDRTNFLRVHRPDLRDELVDRLTLLRAQKTGEFAFGTEVGKTGSLVLRGVLPWRVGGEVVGYLELGKEISQLVEVLRSQMEVCLFVFVHKTYLDREPFREGLRQLNLQTEWDDHPELAHVGRPGHRHPDGLQEYLDSGRWQSEAFLDTAYRYVSEESDHLFFTVPIRDLANRVVIRIVVLRDHHATQRLFQVQQYLFTGLALTITLLLGWLFHRRLGQVEIGIQKAANQLQTSEEGLAEAQRIAQIGNWECQTRESGLNCSAALPALLGGADTEQVTSLDALLDHLHPEDQPLLRQAVNDLLSGQRARIDLECRILRQDQETRYIHFRAEGHAERLFGTLQDITSRKRLEMTVKRNARFLQYAIESMEDGTLLTDDQGKIILHNARFLAMWHLPNPLAEASRERQILAGIAPQLVDREAFIDQMIRVHDSREAAVDMLRLKDGRFLERHGSPVLGTTKIHGWLWRFIDVTARHRAEKREERAMQSRITISALLETGLEPLTLQRQLMVALEIILSVPWLAVLYKGSIFLVDKASGELEMTVQLGLHPHLLSACARVRPGYCLCGRAALGKEILFSPRMDERHEVSFEGITPHGHYCIPIHSHDALLGVLNLYVADGHARNAEEEAFLTTVANLLAGLIKSRRTENRLEEEREFSATVLATAPALMMVIDPSGGILLYNHTCQTLTGHPEAEVKHRKVWEFLLGGEEGARVHEAFSRLSAGDLTTITLESSWPDRTGNVHRIEWRYTATLLPDNRIRNVIAAGHDVTERHHTEQRLTHMAGHDPLTGIPNRRLFHEHLATTIAMTKRNQGRLAVLYLDLDRFKAVNDQYGHETGDWLLGAVVQRIQGCIRQSDILARLGGDEFAIIALQVATPVDPALALVASKIIEEVGRPFLNQNRVCEIGVSIGIALYPDHGADGETLIQRADQMMYQVKQAGRNHFKICGEDDRTVPPPST